MQTARREAPLISRISIEPQARMAARPEPASPPEGEPHPQHVVGIEQNRDIVRMGRDSPAHRSGRAHRPRRYPAEVQVEAGPTREAVKRELSVSFHITLLHSAQKCPDLALKLKTRKRSAPSHVSTTQEAPHSGAEVVMP